MTKTAILAEARAIALQVNTDHSLSRDDRWSLSMRLSRLQQQLGARGVDRAYDDAAAEDATGQED